MNEKINDKSRSKNIHLGEVLLSGLLVPCGLALLLNMEHLCSQAFERSRKGLIST
jgi:hypothetical protein